MNPSKLCPSTRECNPPHSKCRTTHPPSNQKSPNKEEVVQVMSTGLRNWPHAFLRAPGSRQTGAFPVSYIEQGWAGMRPLLTCESWIRIDKPEEAAKPGESP